VFYVALRKLVTRGVPANANATPSVVQA